MARLYVEDWSPEYGAPFESDADPLPSEVAVDTAVEVRGAWEPLPGRDDGARPEGRLVAFVDGVQRLEARLTLDDRDSPPVPGICAAYAVGAAVWDRDARRTDVRHVGVHRIALFAGGVRPPFPAVPGLDYRVEATEASDLPSFSAVLGGRRARAETALVAQIESDACLVVKDGRIDDVGPQNAVGYIKSHSRAYLDPPHSRVIGALRAGERTPIFALTEHFERYSWYVRLADVPHGHSWSGIARVEAPAAIGIERARVLADRTAALLPLAAMPLHLDARAPQNLVPIAALEKELRRWLGDQGLVRRALRAAVHSAGDVTAADAARERAFRTAEVTP